MKMGMTGLGWLSGSMTLASVAPGVLTPVMTRVPLMCKVFGVNAIETGGEK